MRLSKWALATAICAVLTPGLALAQQASSHGLRQPSSVQQTAYEYRDYYSQDPALREMEGGGHIATPAEDAAARAAGGGPYTSDSGAAIEAEEEEGPARLFDFPWLECRNITVAGWVAQTPFTWNPQAPVDRFNGPVTWTDRSNEYQLNQLYWYAEKATDTEGYGWDLGGRIDLLYGTDNRFTRATGLEDDWNSNRFYGLAMPQFYLEPAIGDWKVKLGHFYSPVGYEVVPTVSNFFNSLPYTFQYGEPFTHTGMLASYGGFEKLALGGGFVRGWDGFDGSNPATPPNLNFLGTASYTGDSGASLAFVWVIGNNITQNTQANGDPLFRGRFLQTAVFSAPLNDQWTYVAQSDYGHQNDAQLNGKDGQWYGLNQYLFYAVSDTWTWGIRGEWFRDDGGTRVAGLGSPIGWTGAPGFNGSFYEVTFGANWKPNANFVARPSIRWDWYSGSDNLQGIQPYNNGESSWQLLIGGDIILLY